jgi:hypothetical protein
LSPKQTDPTSARQNYSWADNYVRTALKFGVAPDVSLAKRRALTRLQRLQLAQPRKLWRTVFKQNGPFGKTIFTETPPPSPYGAFASAATDMRMAQITGKLIF